MLVAVATSIVLCTVAGLPRWYTHEKRPVAALPDAIETFGILALAGAVVALVLDVAALRAASRAERDTWQMTPRDPTAPEAPERWLDLGVGDALLEEAHQAPGAYRSHPRVIAVVHGDAPLAARLAFRAIGWDVAAIAISICALAAGNLIR